MNFPGRWLSTAALMLVVVSGMCQGGPLLAAEDSTPSAGAPEKAGEAVGTPAGTPVDAAKAAATAATCKKAIADLGSGKTSALDSLPPETRNALVQDAAVYALSCLAIADDNSRYCDVLGKQKKDECLEHRRIASEIKTLPKEALRAHLVYIACLTSTPKADCEKGREAMTTRDAAKCTGFANASQRRFCAALVTGDAKKCNELTAAERDHCAALAAADPNRCPKDSADCRNLASGLAGANKDGVDAVTVVNPMLAAVRKGKQACAPLLAELEGACNHPSRSK